MEITALSLGAFIAAAVGAFAAGVLIVWTKDLHGKFTLDSTFGVQKVHDVPTPRVGGVAVMFGVLVGYAFTPENAVTAAPRQFLLMVIAAGLCAFLFGLLEDLTKKVSVRARLFATMASGVVGWGITGMRLEPLGIPGVDTVLAFLPFGLIATALVVGGIANAVNLVDGFNGLAAGSMLVMLTAMGALAFSVNDPVILFACVTLACATLGFFLMNWPFGRMFLGDGGSYFLGFSLAWISVALSHRHDEISPWTPLLVCAYPVIEMLFSALRRLLGGESGPGTADRLHLHHFVSDTIVAPRLAAGSRWVNPATAAVLWSLPLLTCLLAWVLRDSPLASGLAFLGVFAAYAGAYQLLARRASATPAVQAA